MEDAFKIPWIDARDVSYVRRGMFRVVIYAWRHFYYDVFVEMCAPTDLGAGSPKPGRAGSTPAAHTNF